MKFVAKKGSKYSDVASRIVNYLCDKDEHAYSTRFAIIHINHLFFRYKKAL